MNSIVYLSFDSFSYDKEEIERCQFYLSEIKSLEEVI